ncbi:fumarylacetoacetate hydrolase family protein [Cohnella rhizosphaerae]|uniref:Fumarylacetoacetate hydrolase family protein n=1 Tax=Cohnella rhizosphaerae TaxID=1457232 RepID=A0A9X4QXC6_9BACL|nr:fumarylacetoacetate hydrolase family protein [Cohnella rhizosphaerae]MDG0814559.1 fumarylacetoacetate hydrolase family protein [Cohnella rhizosphaerae]
MQFTKKDDPSGRVSLGVLENDGQVRLFAEGMELKSLIEETSSGAELPRSPAYAPLFAADDIVLRAPILKPDKMIFIGLNYRDHAAESNMAVPSVPVLFPKFANSIVGPGEAVVIPAEVKECDYEAELAVVIGRRAKKVAREDAMAHVFGYTIVNDVSARDLQLKEGQWTRGKAIDTFAPMGPCVVTADEIPDPGRLDISLALNGTILQHSNTRELIFDIPYLISFLSRTITLEPGDIISTGTPPGVGMGRTPPVWLRDGDVTDVSIEGIGTLSSRYVQERD